ncbi:TPA: hypothetical protein DCW54_01280 [Candidatus Dependentiae bacterium]|nr:hypothetical protein [Candidatus Dependentiae bacterium]
MKRYILGASLALLMVAGLQAEQVVEEVVTPGAQELLMASEWSDPAGAVETIMPVVQPMPLPVDPAKVKEMAVQAVDNLNRFFVLPKEVRDALIVLAQNSDLITQLAKVSWDKVLPMAKDLALDLGPQLREVFRLVQPLAEGNFDGVARVGDALIIKSGDIFEVIFNYHPRLIQILAELKDSIEGRHLKLLLSDFAAQRGFGGTINVANIDYALVQVLKALQNKEVLDAIRNGIAQLKTPGFWDRMEQKFAPEVGALRRLGQQALTEARAIIIDRTGKTPEEWVEIVKARGADGVKQLEQTTGKSVEEMKALAKAKVQELGDLARQNVARVQGQLAAIAS